MGQSWKGRERKKIRWSQKEGNLCLLNVAAGSTLVTHTLTGFPYAHTHDTQQPVASGSIIADSARQLLLSKFSFSRHWCPFHHQQPVSLNFTSASLSRTIDSFSFCSVLYSPSRPPVSLSPRRSWWLCDWLPADGSCFLFMTMMMTMHDDGELAWPEW